MRQPVEQGGGKGWIAQDLGPIGELQVRRQNDGHSIVESGAELEQQVCARGREWDESQLIQHDQLLTQRTIDKAFHLMLGLRAEQFIDQRGSIVKTHPVGLSAGRERKPGRNVCFNSSIRLPSLVGSPVVGGIFLSDWFDGARVILDQIYISLQVAADKGRWDCAIVNAIVHIVGRDSQMLGQARRCPAIANSGATSFCMTEQWNTVGVPNLENRWEWHTKAATGGKAFFGELYGHL